MQSPEDSLNNLLFSSSELPSNDIVDLTLNPNQPLFHQNRFVLLLTASKGQHNQNPGTPHIKFSKDGKGESGKPYDSSFIGKIVCLKDNKNKPFLIVGHDDHHFYAFEGISKNGSSVKRGFSCDLPGFQDMTHFDVKTTPTVHNLYTRRFVIGSLCEKELERLLSSRIVKELKSLNK